MDMISISDGEWKVMNLLWDKSPRSLTELASELKDETGWTKATVNVMLNRLAAKNAVSIGMQGRAKLCSPIIRREDAVKQEAKSALSRIRPSGIGLLVSTMAEESRLSDEEIDELMNILKGAKGK